MNDILENVVAGLTVAAVIWIAGRLWARWHRKERSD